VNTVTVKRSRRALGRKYRPSLVALLASAARDATNPRLAKWLKKLAAGDQRAERPT
jgi:hypothetical protein